MKILGIIPARFASTRFPGKPLADIGGKSMIRRVYEQVSAASHVNQVIVATDDDRIFSHVQDFGGKVCMTRADHASGTDRCYEALTLQTELFDYVVNIQGDEPFIQPAQVDELCRILDGAVEIATLVKIIDSEDELFNPNVVKAVVTREGKALYFSRATIPFQRKPEKDQWLEKGKFYKHIGMYAYRCDILEKISRLKISDLEQAESLEQLRWLENGYSIHVSETNHESFGIDAPEDVAIALKKSTRQA